MSWKLNKSGTCEKQVGEYRLIVRYGEWFIYKGDGMVDCHAYYGWHTSGETDSKVKAERALAKILNNNP